MDLRVHPAAPTPVASGNPEILEVCPFGVGSAKTGFPKAWDKTDEKFQGLGLKLKAFMITF